MVVLLCVSPLGCYHAALVCNNRTTNEEIKVPYGADNPFEPELNQMYLSGLPVLMGYLKQRQVTHEEATAFARKQAMMYIETSAKTREGIRVTFEEVIQKILDTPALLSETGGSVKGLGVRVETDSSGSGCGYC